MNQLAAYGTGFTLGRGNLTTARKYFGSTQAIDFRTDFDIAGNAVKSSDGLGRATSLTYSSPDYGFVTQVCKTVTEAGTAQNRCFTQSSDYAPSADAGGYVGVGGGQLTSRTDLNAVATRFAYNDPLDRVTTATRASGTSVQNQTAFTYTNSNTVITASKDKDTFLDGLLASRTFLDGLGREVEARQFEDGNVNGLNYITVKRGYDALARPYQVSNPARPADVLAYSTTLFDSLGRTKSVTTPDSAVTQFLYTNNQTTVSDPAGKDRKTVTDGLGRVSQVFENPSGVNLQTTYTYNAANSLLGVHQNGAPGDIALADRAFSYDLLQRLTTAGNPESKTTSYPLYDSDGNLQTKIDANGTTTNMSYDELDRLTLKSYQPSATPPTSYAATPTATYTYGSASVPNSAGRLTQVSNGSTSQVSGYDLLGRPTASSQTTNGVVYTFPSYTYNFNNQLKTVTYPSGRTITTTYDSAGRTSQVSGQVNSIGPITTYGTVSSYAPHGGIQQMTLGALTEQTCYNNRLQAVGIRLGNGAMPLCGNSADVLNLSFNYGTTNNNGKWGIYFTQVAPIYCGRRRQS